MVIARSRMAEPAPRIIQTHQGIFFFKEGMEPEKIPAICNY
jgi:hypothetical protein